MVTMLLIAILCSTVFAQVTLAEKPIVRLPPSAFLQLPPTLAAALRQRGCTIPQVTDIKERHNVIRGEFAKTGQTDWAVLCSVKGVSSILVFWNGSPVKPAVLATAEDRGFLQGGASGAMEFSRAIDVASRSFILSHAAAYGGPTPPPIGHQGINDAFVGKASSVHYFYRGKWLGLQGAD